MPSTEPERANHLQSVRCTLTKTQPTNHMPATQHKKPMLANTKRNSALALDLHQPGLWGREGLEDQAAHGVDPKGSVRAAVGVAARPWREG